MKTNVRLGICILTSLLLTLTILQTPKAEAKDSNANLAQTCLNATNIYLYYDTQDGNTFDFNLDKQLPGLSTYFWSINKGKGSPDAVTINRDTGVVTAKKAGTAYILCKVILTDNSVIDLEASVIVRSFKNGVINTYSQERLYDYLKDPNICQISLSSMKQSLITIPEGDYSDKTLVLDGPYISVENYGYFGCIKIRSTRDNVWNEYAENNVFYLSDANLNLNVKSAAKVKSIELITTDANKSKKTSNSQDSKEKGIFNTLNISVSGSVEDINIQAASKVIISGNGILQNVNILQNAVGAKIATYSKCNINAFSDFIITLLSGSECSVITMPNNTPALIENLSRAPVAIYRNTSYSEIIQNYSYRYMDGFNVKMERTYYSSVIQFQPQVASPILATPLISGQELWLSCLNGTFTCNSINIPGTISWANPKMVIYQSGYYPWIFVPYDTEHYTAITGVAEVKVGP